MEKLVQMDAYSGTRILVTGHTGFKGAWLVQMLRALGADVFGVSTDIGQSQPYIKNLFDTEHEFDIDIRERSAIKGLINQIQPKLIFHLAAQSIVSESYFKPLYNYDVNIVGSVNLLEILRFYKKKIR